MRIATFNCNSVRARLETVTGWLDAHRPDLLALQETKVVDALFPREPFEARGYTVYCAGMKGYNGVALLARTPAQSVRFGFEDHGPPDAPRLLHAEWKGLHLINTYVPQGRATDHAMFPYKVAWYGRLRRYIESRLTPRQSVLWLGDLNVAAEPIDVYNPEDRADHVCYHQDVRTAFAHCRDWGFTDVFRAFHPEPGHYSFFDYRTIWRGRDGDGWRLDYLLATKPLARRARDCWIDLEPRRGPRPSDHCFVAADFEG